MEIKNYENLTLRHKICKQQEKYRNMKFQKGISGNPTGRRKGSTNKTPEQIRKLIQLFLENNFQRMQKDFDLLKPNERLMFLNSLLRHVLPEPTSFEKLSEDQLRQLHSYLLKKYSDEQN